MKRTYSQIESAETLRGVSLEHLLCASLVFVISDLADKFRLYDLAYIYKIYELILAPFPSDRRRGQTAGRRGDWVMAHIAEYGERAFTRVAELLPLTFPKRSTPASVPPPYRSSGR
ncbi:hypothetical protein LB516_20705 [Mesorhizobium sp. CO1-1-7]|uniref:hypothetical protein n=1 Tax=Mesorhizobium sp. CO1-1-7 TaxID=2876632 RepID=UPI001CD1942D|nr:hypothetical protein [Mesorhizobium sp. CO1-1-7]MBZ9747671.1 hypothetical protein [Mesorhizobium sp. CO1-1-7]